MESFRNWYFRDAAARWALGGMLAAIALFTAVASAVRVGATETFDRHLLLAMRRPADLQPLGSRSFQEAARDVTALGGSLVLVLVTGSTVGYLLLDEKRRMAGFVCVSVATGWVATTLLKDLFERPRPEVVPHAMYVTTASFPSGHSMRSALVYLTLGTLLAQTHRRGRLQVYFLLLASILTLSIGASRVYLGVHWPTDVLGGWTGGAFWALLCWIAARFLQTRRSLEPPTKNVPGGPGSSEGSRPRH